MIYRVFLLLIFSLHITNAANCDLKYNISHIAEKDSVLINFPSNNILKLDRKIQCNSSSLLIPVYGCVYHCINLGFGQNERISIEMINTTSGTMETCSIEYITPLQPASLNNLTIVNNKVRLDIDRPEGSFDYVQVYCSNNVSYTIFNMSIPPNKSIETVDCAFLDNMSLMSFAFETIEKDIPSVMNELQREVPLPIPFTTYLESTLLTIIADAPPPINIPSSYEFQLFIHDQNNENIVYERNRIIALNSTLGARFMYGLIPLSKHTLVFKHIVPSLGYAQSNQTITTDLNISYPYEVTDLQVKEQFNNIFISWSDPHHAYDPIQYFIQCRSNNQSLISVGRNITHICEQMSLNETTSISVQTQVVIPGYRYDQIAVSQIPIPQVPELPLMKVSDTTEGSITVQWNFSTISFHSNDFQYKINCGLNTDAVNIDIQLNQYQCQSLVQGTLYVITMSVENINRTIQRLNSIQANTLLEKCQYRNHYYSPDENGTRSVVIEWSPPKENFDRIHVSCPSSALLTFEPPHLMSTMFVKCMVPSRQPFSADFITDKSGYSWRILEVTVNPSVETTTTTTTPRITTTTTTTSPRSITETSASTTSTKVSPITTTTRPASTCSPVDITGLQLSLTRWRAAAIVAFILLGFLFLSIIVLIVLTVVLRLRNRKNHIDE